jgi:lipopolysaccharide/colanic/teichoic acid biosynthesis glycosyltransferase
MVLVPFFVIIMVFIKTTSKGPIFYFGERIGLNGKKFRILKFRTMIPDAELQGTTTNINDPRVTRVGFFLRKYKLDELPQLINVIKGEMSLVGPRPEVEEHTNEYTEEEKLILTVRPGLTDYASIRFISLDEILGSENPHQVYVSGVRAEKNQLRMKYVNERSFFVDLKIIGLTFVSLMRKVTGPLG